MAEANIISIPVRFQDIDSMGHVNNTVYPYFLAEARARYYEAVLNINLQAADTVVVHMSIDYRGEITHGDVVDVAVRIPELGASSITMHYTFRVDGETVAKAETVQVMYDREKRASRDIPRAWRNKMEDCEGL